jgi:hypothetical protein
VAYEKPLDASDGTNECEVSACGRSLPRAAAEGGEDFVVVPVPQTFLHGRIATHMPNLLQEKSSANGKIFDSARRELVNKS